MIHKNAVISNGCLVKCRRASDNKALGLHINAISAIFIAVKIDNFIIFSSPGPKAHRYTHAPASVVVVVVVIVVVVNHFQTSFPPKPLGKSKPNFMWSHLGKGELKFVKTV